MMRNVLDRFPFAWARQDSPPAYGGMKGGHSAMEDRNPSQPPRKRGADFMPGHEKCSRQFDMKFSRCGAIAVMALTLLSPAVFGSEDETVPRENQCGARSLYLLARIYGSEATFEDVLEALSDAPDPGGYSMLELRRAARQLGLRLEGVQVKDAVTIDQPMIVFVNDRGHGHFMVLRPAGHTGRIVQVLDPSTWTVLRDREAVEASASWTGFALAPADPWRSVRRLAGLALGLTGGGLLFVHVRERRRARTRPGSQTA